MQKPLSPNWRREAFLKDPGILQCRLKVGPFEQIFKDQRGVGTSLVATKSGRESRPPRDLFRLTLALPFRVIPPYRWILVPQESYTSV
jgi:hypothetical protein